MLYGNGSWFWVVGFSSAQTLMTGHKGGFTRHCSAFKFSISTCRTNQLYNRLREITV